MDVIDNACVLDKRVALASIASKLAPTKDFSFLELSAEWS
jgi:hypothetical protein